VTRMSERMMLSMI